MNFLVLGAGGMAGHTIAAYLHEQGHDVLGWVHRPLRLPGETFPTVIGDVRKRSLLENMIRDGRYDAVINCIGVLNQFAEQDKEQAVYLNAYLPHFLASVTTDLPTQIVHMSTDCVFSGTRGGYREDDLRDGTTFYDRTKALGELEDKKNITFRQSIVGPDLNPDGIGLFNWFMRQQGEIRGFSRAIWTGVTTLELAKAMEEAVAGQVTGLHHMVYDEPVNKHDLILLFQKHMGKNNVTIQPFADFVSDKSLVRTRFDFARKIPDYGTMVADMAAWIRAHRSWYPHYELGE